MKILMSLILLLSFSICYANNNKLDGFPFECGQNEALKINMISISKAILECNKLGLTAGENCNEDSECSSSCCDPSSGQCKIHNPTTNHFCSKQQGQSCKDNSYCAKEYRTKCFIVLNGHDHRGKETCALRCLTGLVDGLCTANICHPAKIPAIPDFDVNNPNRCDDAIDPSEIEF